MTRPLTLSPFLLVLLLFACKKPAEKPELPENPEFSYSTTKDLEINLKFLSADGKPLQRVLVNFYFPDSKTTADPVYKGLTDDQGVLHGSFAAPTYKKGLIVDLNYPGISRNMTMFLENNTITGTIKASVVKSANARTSAVDSDSDTVEDIYDEFPNDPKRAFTKYYPSKTGWGTLAFEDNWPNKGDYDMNDLVVQYHYAIVCDYRGFYVEMDCNYKVLAAGAGYTNGFGVTLPYIKVLSGGQSLIQSVSGQKLTSNYITMSALGFDELGTNIIPFDNHRSMFNGNTGMVNTIVGAPKETSDAFTVKVNFKYPVNAAAYSGNVSVGRSSVRLWDVPFNPFLICNMKKKHEVHQAGYGPSQTAKDAGIMSLYNTGDDAGVPQVFQEYPTGLYRSKDGGKPWVLNFAETFDYPTEYSSLSKAYLHFDKWRAGQGYDDWYLDKPGYRDANLIYR